MKKKMICLLILITVFIVGCGKDNFVEKNTKPVEKKETEVVANIKFGSSKVYVPKDFTYRPDLRGLIYSEDERKLYINGDPSDRSTAVIIDLIREKNNNYLEQYINKINERLTDVKYRLIKEKPVKLFAREKYKGKSGDTVIYNYTYITKYNDYIYQFTVSGPESKESELNTLKTNLVKSLRMEN